MDIKELETWSSKIIKYKLIFKTLFTALVQGVNSFYFIISFLFLNALQNVSTVAMENERKLK